jgi:hypothetical protein
MFIKMRSKYYVMRNLVSRPNFRLRLIIRGFAPEASLIRNADRRRNASPPAATT